MVLYTGQMVTSRNALGFTGDTTEVVAKFSFVAATLTTADTFEVDAFLQNNVKKNVELIGATLYSSTTTPAGLALQFGNVDDVGGIFRPTLCTETGQLVRKATGDLIGKIIDKIKVTGVVTTNASASYTGDLFISFLVRPCNNV